MNVLVTGGAGFIGSHTCVELLNAGHEVIVADNLSNSRETTLKAIDGISARPVSAFYRIDLRDKEELRKVFSRHQPDAVIHLAGFKAVAESIERPLDYYDNNIGSTLVLCEIMKDAGVNKLVFSSSATVYGTAHKAPFREEMTLSAINPYGYTKVMIERILTDLASADPDWRICTLRYFNPIGAHPSGLIGEDPNGIPNNLVPYVAQVAAGLRTEVAVYGDDYDTPDGTGVRDYIHVVDLAQGHLAALEYTSEHAGIQVFNLGTGRGTSVLQVIEAYSKACGHDIPFCVADRRPGDIATCYADTAKAERVLGWKATRGIEEMCADSWNFARARYEQSVPAEAL